MTTIILTEAFAINDFSFEWNECAQGYVVTSPAGSSLSIQPDDHWTNVNGFINFQFVESDMTDDEEEAVESILCESDEIDAWENALSAIRQCDEKLEAYEKTREGGSLLLSELERIANIDD